MITAKMFADRVFGLMREKSITPSMMSESIGLGINAIEYWIDNDIVPDVFVQRKIAKYLGTTVGYLNGETDDKSPNGTSTIVIEVSAQEEILISLFRAANDEKKCRIINELSVTKNE